MNKPTNKISTAFAMFKTTLFFAIPLFMFFGLSIPQATNAQSSKDKGWVWLFNGTNTDQWRSPKSEEFPAHGWTIENKTLIVNKNGDKADRGGDIITRKKYSSFDLRFEFKLAKGANSGLKYFVKIYPENGSALGCEYQLIDDLNNKDIANDVDAKRKTASLYELFEPSTEALKPAREWNKGRILVDGKHVEHWLNGKKVVEYERGSQRFLDARAKSKFKDVEDFGLIREGYILLQDHGDQAAFRNIKIKEL